MKKVNRKGQITIFILLGVVISIGVSLIFFIDNNVQENSEIAKTYELSLNIAPIKSYVESCIKDVGKKGLIFIGKHGGYYNLPEPSLNDDYFKLPYYFFENLDLSPSIEIIQNEFSYYINENLLLCLNDFNEFKEMGFGIQYDDLNTNTIIGEKDVSINVNFPTRIQKENDIIAIDNYNVRIDKAPIKKLNEMSKEIVNMQLQDPTSICLSCLYDLGEKYDFYANVVEYVDNNLVFELRSYNTSITGIYNFTFAVSYPEVSCNNLAYVDDFIFARECLEKAKENA